MCGRFPYPDSEEIKRKIKKEISEEKSANYNTTVTDAAPVVTNQQTDIVQFLRWGFDYPVMKEGKTIKKKNNDDEIAVKQFINARAEGLMETKTFKGLIKNNRCIVYSKGFYEWSVKGGDGKQPFLFQVKDSDFTVFAGLWQNRRLLNKNRNEDCFVIVTIEPNELVGAFHDRMPVILDQQDQELWLSNDLSDAELLSILKPYPSEKMHCFPVSKAVNSTRNQSASFLVPFEDKQQRLF